MTAWTSDPRSENCLRLSAPLEPNAEIAVEIAVNGEPVPPEQVRFGAEGAPRALTGQPFKAGEAAAPPNARQPETLPDEFTVCVWYVDQTGQRTDEELDPEMLEELGALGYIE
jgi:hypothetical protein